MRRAYLVLCEGGRAIGKRKNMRMNELIRVPQVRLIGEEGEQLGIVDTEDALRRAQAESLDLVEISPTATPPVCRIMDFGKYKYQQQKKQHDQKRKHHGQELKQLRIKSFLIDPHDIGIKLKKAREFIEDGHRLILTLMFRAREHSHSDLGEKLLVAQFAQSLADVAKIDAPPRKDGRRMTMTLSPLPNLKQILAQRERERAAAAKRAASESARTQVESPPADDGDEGADADVEDAADEE